MNLRQYKTSIVNVVVTADLHQRVDLVLAHSPPNIIYDLDFYHCAYLKEKDMQGKVSIFTSGKMISIGTTSEQEAMRNLRRAAEVLSGAGIIKPVKIDGKVQNVVATIDLGQPLDLERLVIKLANVIYEPEHFPGIVYRPQSYQDMTVLIFSSGKLVLAGIRSTKLVPRIAEQIVQDILSSSIYPIN